MPDFYIVPPRLMVGSFDRAAVVNSINTLKGDLTFTADPLTGVKLVTSGNNIQIGLIPNYFVKKAGDYVTGNIQFTPSGTNYGLQVFYNASDPATGATGALYFNTTDNQLKIYDNTGWNVIQSTSGISASYANQYYLRLDASNDPMQGDLDMGTYFFKIGNKATQVVAGSQGQVYFNTDTKRIDVYNGTAWVPIGLGITSITASTGLTSTQNPITSSATLSVNTAANFIWTGTHTFNSPVIFAAAGQTFNISNLFISGQSQGDLITYNGSNWARYGIGASGQVLTVNTSGNGVTWADPTGSTGTASSSGFATTSYNINLVQTSENNNFYLTFSKYTNGSGVALSAGVGLSFNPSTNTLTTSNIFGTLQTANQPNITGLGTITSGVWAATAITARYGGTGYTTYTSGTILVGAGSTFITLTPGTQNYVLTSSNIFSSGIGWSYTSGAAISSSPPAQSNVSQFWWDDSDGSLSIYYDDGNGSAQWVEVVGGFASTGGGGTGSGTVNSGTANYAAYYPADGTAVSSSSDLYFSSGNGLTITPTTNSISTSTGALVINGGAGIAKSLSLGGRLQLFNGANYTAFVSSASGNTVYTLPATSPQSSLGTSVLSSSIDGVLSWVPMTATGSGSGGTGTVTSGTAGSVAFYSSTGNTVVGSSDIFISSGNGITINPTTNSDSITTGALVVRGGVGIAGTVNIGSNLFVRSGKEFRLYDSGNTAFSGFKYTGASDTLYTLPTTYPGSGVTILTSDTNGNLAWVAISSVGLATTAQNVNLVSATTNASHYIVFSPQANGSGVALSSETALRYNPSTDILSSSGISVTSSTASTTATTGALIVTGGAGVGQSVSIGGRLQLFNGSNFTSFVSSATANTVYSLPATSPGAGTSYLVSTSAGVMSWVVSPFVSLNGLSGNAQTFAVGTTGVNFNISSSGSTHTFNIPIAGTGATGLVTGTAQTFGGLKTFANGLLSTPAIGNSSGGTGFSTYSTGDLLAGTGATLTRLSVGTNNFVLIANSNQISGLAWTSISSLPTSFIGLGSTTVGLGTTLNLVAGYGVTISYTSNALTFRSGVAISNTYPSGALSGDLFWHDEEGNLKIYYDDGQNEAQWVDASQRWGSGQYITLPGLGAGTIYQMAYYAASGHTVYGDASFTNNVSTGVVSITHATGSTSSSSGALVVTGGVGVGGTVTANSFKSNTGYIENVYAGGNVSTGATIYPNWALGSVQTYTLTGNCWLGLPTNMPTGASLTLVISQDGSGGWGMTSNSSYKYSGGSKTLSTAASAIDVINMFYTGSIYLASLTTGYS